jgi:hypothetical protein
MYLSFDRFVFGLNGSSGEFDADGGFRFQIEFVARESRQQVRLADARVADLNRNIT